MQMNLTISTHPKTQQYVFISPEGDAYFTANQLAELMGVEVFEITKAPAFVSLTNLIKAEDAVDIISYYLDNAPVSKDTSTARSIRLTISRMGAIPFAYAVSGYKAPIKKGNSLLDWVLILTVIIILVTVWH